MFEIGLGGLGGLGVSTLWDFLGIGRRTGTGTTACIG